MLYRKVSPKLSENEYDLTVLGVHADAFHTSELELISFTQGF